MNNKEDNKDLDKTMNILGEDATKYGEMVSSYFAWIPLAKQKEKAEKLDNVTKDKKLNKNKEKNNS